VRGDFRLSIVIIERARLLTIVFRLEVALVIAKLGLTPVEEIPTHTLVHFYLYLSLRRAPIDALLPARFSAVN